MATYKVKVLKDGKIQIWARYQPFEGASTKSHIVVGDPEAIASMAVQAAEWVAKQRPGHTPDRD